MNAATASIIRSTRVVALQQLAASREEVVMARVSYVEMEQAPPEVREIYEQKLKGKPGNIQKALAHRPELLKNFLNFYGSVGKSLDRRLFELLYLKVSMVNHCQY